MTVEDRTRLLCRILTGSAGICRSRGLAPVANSMELAKQVSFGMLILNES
jgi:hypothetical protein